MKTMHSKNSNKEFVIVVLNSVGKSLIETYVAMKRILIMLYNHKVNFGANMFLKWLLCLYPYCKENKNLFLQIFYSIFNGIFTFQENDSNYIIIAVIII